MLKNHHNFSELESAGSFLKAFFPSSTYRFSLVKEKLIASKCKIASLPSFNEFPSNLLFFQLAFNQWLAILIHNCGYLKILLNVLFQKYIVSPHKGIFVIQTQFPPNNNNNNHKEIVLLKKRKRKKSSQEYVFIIFL